ncbi:hypothetical protein TNCV_3336471 [Trichonephila clavipes]|nr:hypothetical protein TNCV_3336471 [Trichonephila clavipes]
MGLRIGVLPLQTYNIPREVVSLLSAAPYKRTRIAARNFDAHFPPQTEAPVLWRCETVLRILILQSALKPNRHSKDPLHAA